MRLTLINAYESSPFDDLFHMSAFRRAGSAVIKFLLRVGNVNMGGAMTPLALPVLTALTPEDWDVTVVDEQVDRLDFDMDADLVGVSFNTPSADRAYRIADKIRSKGIKVVVGGSHASVMKDEASLHADSVCIGEAEYYWHQVLKDAANGKLKKFYCAEEYPPLSDTPTPDFSAIDRSKYFPLHPIQTSRGCPYNCEFCTVHRLFGRKVRTRSIESLEREIDSIDQKYIAFVDDNLGINKKHLEQLLEALKGKKKKWGAQVNLNIAKDTKLLESMYEAGCTVLLVGLETMSPQNMNKFAARKNDVEMMGVYIRRMLDAGIAVLGMYILGFDHDNKNSLQTLTEFCLESQITFPSISILTPFPGSDIYRDMEAERRLIHSDWSKYNFFKTVFKPKQFVEGELEQYVSEVGLRVYKMRDVISRAWRHREMFPLLLFIGLSFRMGYRSLARNLKKRQNKVH